MKCRHKRNEWIGYLLGELSSKQQMRMESHLKECMACQKVTEELKSTLTVLNRVTPPPQDFSGGDVFVYEIHHKMERREIVSSRSRRFRQAAAGLTIVLLMAVMVIKLIHQKPDSPVVQPGSVSHLVKAEPMSSRLQTPTIRLRTSVKPVSMMSGPSNVSTMTQPKFPRKPRINLHIKTISGIQKS